MAVVNQQNISFPTVKWLVRTSFAVFMHYTSLKHLWGKHLFFFPCSILALSVVWDTFFPGKHIFATRVFCKNQLISGCLSNRCLRITFPLCYTFPFPLIFSSARKYENNTSPCGRWHAMFSQANPQSRGGLNIIAAVVCSLHSQREHNSSITRLLLPGHSMSACLPSSCAPLSSQAERMINYTKLLHAD